MQKSGIRDRKHNHKLDQFQKGYCNFYLIKLINWQTAPIGYYSKPIWLGLSGINLLAIGGWLYKNCSKLCFKNFLLYRK